MEKEIDVDVSIIMRVDDNNKTNKSIIDCIDYCSKRGITTELLADEKHSKGKYICIIDNRTYYQDYYLHLQYVALEFKNKKNNRFQFNKCTCYDSINKEFYCGNYSLTNKFYRKLKGDIEPSYVEDKIFMGCTLNELSYTHCQIPPDNILKYYHDYFVDNKYIND